MELNHFVKFLDFQLDACENSVFCKKDLVKEALPGLKTFVINFMIRMSKVHTYLLYNALYCTFVHMYMCRILPHHL